MLPDVLDRVQLRRTRGQQDGRDVRGHGEVRRRVPSGAIEDQNGVCAPGDVPRYLVEMQLHGEGVGERQGERRALAARRADRAEQIGVLVALIGGLARPCAAPGPLAHKPVLLADPGFILKPHLDSRSLRQIGKMGAQRAREIFLYAATISASWPGCRGRAEIWEKPSFLRSVPT